MCETYKYRTVELKMDREEIYCRETYMLRTDTGGEMHGGIFMYLTCFLRQHHLREKILLQN